MAAMTPGERVEVDGATAAMEDEDGALLAEGDDADEIGDPVRVATLSKSPAFHLI